MRAGGSSYKGTKERRWLAEQDLKVERTKHQAAFQAELDTQEDAETEVRERAAFLAELDALQRKVKRTD